MEYLHRRKEAPMQGMTGLWGGVGSNLVSAAPSNLVEGGKGHSLPISGGSNWFAPGHYGYEDQSNYTFPNNAVLDQIYYQRLQNGSYEWWSLIWQKNNNTNFTLKYGARIAVPGGTGNSQIGPVDLDSFTTIGSPTLQGSGTLVYGWNSGITADQQAGPPHYVDSDSGGTIGYNPWSAPLTSSEIDDVVSFNDNETGQNFHAHITYDAPG
tara:strand:+ start:276 stop:905 length:630 start_codon:yes stop_codon:yes gene_type:complete